MLVSLTVGKVDAGVTVLLTPDKRLVGLEFPCYFIRGSRYPNVRSRLSDRVPLYPPAPRHLIRQHRRHHRRPEQGQGGRRTEGVPRAPGPDIQLLRRQ